MSIAKIRFASSILKRLGEELNPTPELGLIELAKNSYDANALNCTFTIENTDQIGGKITISDDGDGMAEDDIINGWLVLGSSRKSTKNKTRLGRIPAGNKGLGRLAALRLGKKVIMTSRPRGSRHTFELSIDWDKYDQEILVDNVNLELNRHDRNLEESDGTQIVIEDLRQPLKKAVIKRLARGLILLADPFQDIANAFKPELIASEFSDLEELVSKRYFNDAEFFLSAKIEKGIANAVVNDWRGNSILEADHGEIAFKRNKKRYECPSADFDLWVFILGQDIFSTRQTTIGEVRSWLEEFGGVHLYQNGLRVNPYGNPGNDWLSINLSRAKSPEERPSTNTVIGRMQIHDGNELLVQKTDRSGFIETESFEELRDFGKDVLDWLARKRLDLAEKRRAQKRVESKDKSIKSSQNVEKAIESAHPEAREEIQKSFEKYKKSRDKEVDILRKEVQLYRTLSTAGITSATFSHESNSNPIKVISLSTKTIEMAGKKYFAVEFENYVKDPIDRIRNSTKSLSVLGEATLNLLQHEKRRFSRIDLHSIIRKVCNTFQPFVNGRDVIMEMKFEATGKPYLRGSEASIESIITNLINNSLNALEGAVVTERRILLRTEIIGSNFILSISDNGEGIEGISIKEIWLPGKTTRQNGTGLGLTIVRDSVIDLGGTVDAVAKGELGGATIIIELPILGK